MKLKYQKKVCIRSYGSDKYGMGHLYRSLVVSQILAKNGFEPSYLMTPSEKDQLSDFIEQKNIRVETIGEHCGFVSKFLIYDMPFADSRLISCFKKINPVSRVIALDYSDSHDQNVDIVINLFDHPRMLSGRDKNHHTKFLTGLQYAIIREDFFKLRISQRKISKNIRKILISFGGADPSGHTYKLLKNPELFGKKEISVTIGPNFRDNDKILELSPKLPPTIKILGTVGSIHELMADSDLIICGAGTTMLEAFFIGTPVLVMPQTEDELNFAKFAESMNLCDIESPENIDKLLLKINDLEDLGKRAKLSLNGMSVVDGNGGKRIAEIAVS